MTFVINFAKYARFRYLVCRFLLLHDLPERAENGARPHNSKRMSARTGIPESGHRHAVREAIESRTVGGICLPA